MSTPKTETSFSQHIAKEYHLRFDGVVDAPEDTEVDMPLMACRADPVNPLLCVIAKNAKQNAGLFPGGFLDAAIEGNKAFTAHANEDGESFRLLRWKHNGSWVVNAFDSKDPVKIALMRRRVDKGAHVLFERPDPRISHKAKPRDPNAPPKAPAVKRAKSLMPSRRQRMADMVSTPVQGGW